MNSYTKTVVISLFCGLLVLPSTTSAATAQLITDTVALFTIEVSVPVDTFINELPIAASDTVSYTDKVDMIGVSIEDSAGATSTDVSVNALLLGTAPIVGTRYYVEAGTPATFTLLIIATFAEPVAEPYTAHITKLPYWLNGQRTSVHQNQLDEFPAATLTLE